MLAQEIIRAKRDGGVLGEAQIAHFVRGLVDNSWSEGQAAALAMAIFWRGMQAAECAQLTRAMTHSGEVLDWKASNLPGPILDKHSTGGVGDKVSLMLAPIAAACGGFVPMISGRGLGHTGGTLDKFDSIPGYNTKPEAALFRSVVAQAGCAIVGQTAQLAPADQRLYAIRDVTATVESIPLITASILSKKLAAGLQGLVMDVKTGNGAFAADLGMAQELAKSIVSVAGAAGLRTRALVTDMNQVLGSTCGNALEMQEALDFLNGKQREPRLLEVTRSLGAHMLLIGGLHSDLPKALTAVDHALNSGAALERFARMVTLLGGPADFVERSGKYITAAPVQKPVIATQSGYISAMQTREIGLTVVELGGGRRKASDAIDYRVGITEMRALGERIENGDVLALVHAANAASANAACERLVPLIQISDAAPQPSPVVIELIEA
jgi:thymidine phosphorylase